MPARTVQARWLKVFTIPSRLAISVRQYGMRAACRRGWRRAGELLRERHLGIHTAGSIDATTLKTGADSFGYQPIPYAAIESALQSIGVRGHDVFIDMGCGMGRAVVVASTKPMRRAIGVEISAELCELARRNVERARRHFHTDQVEIVESDAREYDIPDDTTILLLFNPFDEPVLRQVLANVHRSLVSNPRKLTIVYAIPASRQDVLVEVPWLQLDQEVQIRDEEWLSLGIYRSRELA